LRKIASIPARLTITGILILLAIVKVVDVSLDGAISSHNSGLPALAQTEYLQEDQLLNGTEVIHIDFFALENPVKRALKHSPVVGGPFFSSYRSFHVNSKFLKLKVRTGFTAPVSAHVSKFNIPHHNIDKEDPLRLS
jgi:hypothetical protein